MKNRSLIPLAMAILVGLALAAAAAWASPDPGTAEDAAAQQRATGSGGIPANPIEQGPGGGGRAPANYGAQAAQTGDEPDGEAVQEPTPTTPEGQPQQPEQQPEEQPPPDEEIIGPVGEQPSGQAPSTSGGGLPSTGLELAAMLAVGLGLLIGGAALRPRRGRRPVTARR
jgi:hypothetical protein